MGRTGRRILEEEVQMPDLVVPEHAAVRIQQIVSADHVPASRYVHGAIAFDGAHRGSGRADDPGVDDVRTLEQQARYDGVGHHGAAAGAVAPYQHLLMVHSQGSAKGDPVLRFEVLRPGGFQNHPPNPSHATTNRPIVDIGCYRPHEGIRTGRELEDKCATSAKSKSNGVEDVSTENVLSGILAASR